jgi:hypothetical protein
MFKINQSTCMSFKIAHYLKGIKDYFDAGNGQASV